MHEIGVSVIWLCLQVTVVMVVSSLLYLCVRRQGPLLRSLVISSSMLIALLMAVLIFSPWPRWSSEKTAQPVIVEQQLAAMTDEKNATQKSEVPRPEVTASHLKSIGSSAWGGFLEGLKQASPAENQGQSLSWPAIIGFLFLSGMVVGLMRLCFGYILLRREVQHSNSLKGTTAREILDGLLTRQTKQPLICLQETERLATAAVIGWWRPVILLPATWRNWSLEQLQAVLMHELTHIRQRDFLSNFCAEINRSVHFYHPLMHWLAARLRLEQELAADAAAAHSTGGAEPYLVILAEMAMAQSNRSVRGPARAFLPTHSTFLRRIDMLKAKSPFIGTISRGARAAAVTTIVFAGMLAIGIRGDRESIAQNVSPIKATSVEAKDKAQKFRIDFVPSNALAVIAIRPADILAQKSMMPIRKLIEQEKSKNRNIEVIGLEPAEIKTATVIFLAPDSNVTREQDMNATTIIQLNREIDRNDRKTILKKFSSKKLIEVNYDGKTYHKVAANYAASLLFLNTDTLVIAENEKAMQQVIDTLHNGGTSPWKKQWETVESDSVAGILDMRVARAIVGDEHARVAAANAPMLGIISPIWENTDVATLGLKIDQKFALSATLSQEKNGDSVKNTLDALLTLAKNMRSQMNRGAAGNDVQERLAIMSFMSVAEKILNTAKVTQKGEDVILTTSLPDDSGIHMVAVLVPALMQAREAARRSMGKNNLKQILLAFHNYHAVHKHFPPAVVIGPDGKTPHSWRVEILPYIDQSALYKEYHLDEPWDSEHNKKVLAKIPAVFRNPNADGDPHNSSYFAVVGKKTAFGDKDGVQIRDITDGTSNSIAVVEAKRDIPWTKPEDIRFDGKKLPEFGGFHQGGYFVALCDGAVRFISENIDPKTLKKLLEINDGLPFP